LARANASHSDYKYRVFPAPLRAAFRQPTTIGEVLEDRISSALNRASENPGILVSGFTGIEYYRCRGDRLEMLKGSLAYNWTCCKAYNASDGWRPPGMLEITLKLDEDVLSALRVLFFLTRRLID
jgi:hypothetical protein